MSVNQHYRRAWVKAIFAQAVDLFHKTRYESHNADVPLPNLARQCANTLFSENKDTIVGDKEICAREFMAYCREHFLEEIHKALLSEKPKEEAKAS